MSRKFFPRTGNDKCAGCVAYFDVWIFSWEKTKQTKKKPCTLFLKRKIPFQKYIYPRWELCYKCAWEDKQAAGDACEVLENHPANLPRSTSVCFAWDNNGEFKFCLRALIRLWVFEHRNHIKPVSRQLFWLFLQTKMHYDTFLQNWQQV